MRFGAPARNADDSTCQMGTRPAVENEGIRIDQQHANDTYEQLRDWVLRTYSIKDPLGDDNDENPYLSAPKHSYQSLQSATCAVCKQSQSGSQNACSTTGQSCHSLLIT